MTDNDDINAAPHGVFPAPVQNPDLSAAWRYGWLVWWVATLALLVTSDVGSGVQALTQTVPNNERLQFNSREQVLLDASVFSSVKELWDAGSKPLAIFVVITSIAWPYIKLLLTLYAWIRPIRNAVRRERLLVVLDVLGKWSLADVVVFVVIMVVFRERIPLGAGHLEVWIVAQWGLFGFVAASLSSLLATHVALYFHRRIVYNTSIDSSSDNPTSQSVASHMSSGTRLAVSLLWVIALGAYMVGCILYTFQVTNTQNGVDRGTKSFSIASIGRALPDAKRDYEPEGGLRFFQILWFLLGLGMPGLLLLLVMVVLYQNMTMARLRTWFLAAEIALAWSGCEVLVLSVVLAIREIPTFGDGLIETGCNSCYVVETDFLTVPVLLWVVGTVATLAVTAMVLRAAHHQAYPEVTRAKPSSAHRNGEEEEAASS